MGGSHSSLAWRSPRPSSRSTALVCSRGARILLPAPPSLTCPQDPPPEAKVAHLSAKGPRPGKDPKDSGLTLARKTAPGWSQGPFAPLTASSVAWTVQFDSSPHALL